MDLSKLSIRHGKLTSLQGALPHGELRAWRGTPQTAAGITLVAAGVELSGMSFSLSHKLSEHIAQLELPADVRALLLDGDDGPWVRGRIERLFRISTPNAEERTEKSGLRGEFLALIPEQDGSLVGIPFWCEDYYLQTGLMFSEQEDPPPADVADRIAAAFWSLLLAEPHDLPDYRDRTFSLRSRCLVGIRHREWAALHRRTRGRTSIAAEGEHMKRLVVQLQPGRSLGLDVADAVARLSRLTTHVRVTKGEECSKRWHRQR